MEFKGTKGEWKVNLCGDTRSIINTNEKSLVDVWYALSDNFPSKDEGKANAKLIAAAPELLAFAIEMVKRYPNSPWITNQATEAINKALN